MPIIFTATKKQALEKVCGMLQDFEAMYGNGLEVRVDLKGPPETPWRVTYGPIQEDTQ
jgi:hypothetical protein